MNRQTFSCIERYMHSCMKDSAHDREHVYRVLNNALRIAEGIPNVDMDVLIASALLHDISRPEQLADGRIDHAHHGADKAYAFLSVKGFPAKFCNHVRSCIRTHRFRKTEPPASIEAKILFDADKLDAAGAVGIARTLIYKGQVQEPLYTMNPDGTVCDGTNTDDVSFFEEYKHKLEKLYSGFHTKTGIAMAKERQQTAVRYYEALLAEVSAPYVEGRNALEHILD